MKVVEAEAAIKALVPELVGLPSELAHAIHAKAAGRHPGTVSADTWAELRKDAKDIEDIDVDKQIAAIRAAIDGIRAAVA